MKKVGVNQTFPWSLHCVIWGGGGLYRFYSFGNTVNVHVREILCTRHWRAACFSEPRLFIWTEYFSVKGWVNLKIKDRMKSPFGWSLRSIVFEKALVSWNKNLIWLLCVYFIVEIICVCLQTASQPIGIDVGSRCETGLFTAKTRLEASLSSCNFPFFFKNLTMANENASVVMAPEAEAIVQHFEVFDVKDIGSQRWGSCPFRFHGIYVNNAAKNATFCILPTSTSLIKVDCSNLIWIYLNLDI